MARLLREDRKIFSNFCWVGIFLLLAKLAGAAKEVVIAWRYGVSPVVDSYIFVFNLLAWFSGILGGAPFFTLLPPLVAKWKQINIRELNLFQYELFGFVTCLGIILSIAGPWILWFFFKQGWIEQTSMQLNYSLVIVFQLGSLVLFGLLISLFSAWTLAEERQINTLFEGAPAFIICLFLLFQPIAGVGDLIWGTVVGFIAHTILLLGHLWKGNLFRVIRIGFSSSIWSNFFKNSGILIIGQIALSLTSTLDLFAAVHLGDGSISILNYSNRILMLISSLGAVVIQRSILPVFSRIQDRNDEVNTLAMRWAAYTFLAGIVIAFVSYFVSTWGVRVIFERGAFDASSTENVSNVFRYAILQIPFYFPWIVLTALLSARWKFNLLVSIFMVNLFFKIIGLLLCIPYFGINGIQISSALMYLASMGVILSLRKKWW